MSYTEMADDDVALFDETYQWSDTWTCRPVSRITAERWISRFHYSGSIGATGTSFGIFGPDMVAAVQVGAPGGGVNVSGIAAKYRLEQWPGNREITRVAVHPDAPKNTASRTVAMVLRHLRADGLAWVYSYADTGQGHHGGIYQALNAVYVGMGESVGGYEIDGRTVHPRQVVSMFGSRSAATVERLRAGGVDIRQVADQITPKHLYVIPIGGPSVSRAIRQHLTPWSMPYPKRVAALTHPGGRE